MWEETRKREGYRYKKFVWKTQENIKKQTSIAIIKIFLKCEKTLKNQNKTKQKQTKNPKSIAVIKIL